MWLSLSLYPFTLISHYIAVKKNHTMPYFNSQLYPLNLLTLFLSCRPTSKELVGECWLQSARVARKAGHHQTAFNALLNAENTHLAELVSEKAKWLWCKVKPTCMPVLAINSYYFC